MKHLMADGLEPTVVRGFSKYTRMMITRSFSKRAICSFRREA